MVTVPLQVLVSNSEVKQRQLNKFNNLNKKEGNITRVNSSPNLVMSQAGRQAGTLLPPREGSSLVASQGPKIVTSQAGRQAGTLLPLGEGSSLVASQAGSQAVTSQTGFSFPLRKEVT